MPATLKHARRLAQIRTIREETAPDMLPAAATAHPLHHLKTNQAKSIDPKDAADRIAHVREILGGNQLDDAAKWNMLTAYVNESAQGTGSKTVASPEAAARNVGAAIGESHDWPTTAPKPGTMPASELESLIESRRKATAARKANRKVPRLVNARR